MFCFETKLSSKSYLWITEHIECGLNLIFRDAYEPISLRIHNGNQLCSTYTKFPKTLNFWPPNTKDLYAYQGVRNVSFSENFVNVRYDWSTRAWPDKFWIGFCKIMTSSLLPPWQVCKSKIKVVMEYLSNI